MSDPNDNPPFKKTKIEPEPTEDFKLPPPGDNLPYSGKIWTKDAPSVHITMPASAEKPSERHAEATEAPASSGPVESPAAPPPPPRPLEAANDDPSSDWREINLDLMRTIPDVVFPLHLFPAPVAEWIAGTARAAGVPMGFVAMVFLASVAAAIGNAREANPLPGWFEAIFLWVVLVGDPSSGKSPALGGSLAVYRAVEALERGAHRAAFGASGATGPAKAGALRERLRRAAEAQGLEHPDLQGPDVGPVPPVPQLICGVTTLPGLEELALANPKGLLIVLDEITRFLEQKGDFRSVLLSLYNAEPHRRTTAKGDIDLAHLGAGFVGGIQPGKLDPMLHAMSADGLGGRLLLALGEGGPVERVSEEVDPSAMVAALFRLRDLEMDVDDSGVLHPRVVPFTIAAGDLIHARRVAAREMQDSEHGNLCAFTGKSPGTVVRLSLIMTFLKAAVAGDPMPDEVDAEAVERAGALFDGFLLPMARAAFASETLAPVVREARDLVAVLRRRGDHYISNRDLLRSPGHKLRTVAQLAPVTAVLIDEGILRLVDGDPTLGRPSPGFDVNPRLWATRRTGSA